MNIHDEMDISHNSKSKFEFIKIYEILYDIMGDG